MRLATVLKKHLNAGRRSLLFIVLCTFAVVAHAEIFAYTTPKGVRLYTDAPLFERGYKPMNKAARNARRLRNSTAANAAVIDRLVTQLAPYYGLDPKLVSAVIRVESNYDVRAVSSANAAGLMQLIPATAQRFGVVDRFDATDNIKGGMAYLRWLMSRFEGDVSLVLAGYNAGENAVAKYGGVPPFKETQRYIQKVRSLYGKTWHPFEAKHATSWRKKTQDKAPYQLASAEGRS